MRTLHASGWWKTPNADVRAQVAEWIEAHAPRYLTHTEAGKHRAALTLHDGYGVIHPRGDEGQAECAIQYRLDGPPLVRSEAVRLSSLPIPRRNGDFCYAVHAEFADHHHIALHLPSGVNGGGGLLDNEQSRVYRDAIGGLRRFVATLDGAVIITGDWNLSLHGEWVRKCLTAHFPDFTPTVIPVAGGTHGGRFIDFSLVRGFTAHTERVMKTDTSDHRALLERLTIREHAVIDPYAITAHDGKRVDEITHQALLAAEKELGYELTIVQGSYNGGKVSASAGTHDGGGVVDLAPWDAERKVRVLRSIGFAAWHRPKIEGLWGSHIHAVLIGNRRLSDSANRQVQAYLAGRNGLANNGPDDGPREFTDRRFVWPPPPPAPTRVSRARVLFEQALKFAGPKRKAAILAALDRAPKR